MTAESGARTSQYREPKIESVAELTSARLRASCANPAPPQVIADTRHPDLLKAMWLAERGHWEAAHTLAQEDDSETGAWVHAYLHRVEGDLDNAGYWYGRAGRRRCDSELELEWEEIVDALIGQA
ncbi:MAG: hypothetical protein AAF458_19750 [Pseudomonadota bacterium]